MLPRAVREAGERADAILAQLAAGNTAPEPQEAEPAPEPQQQVTAPAVEPQPAPAPAPAVLSDDWEQKYRALAGKYSAEVPRYADEVRELKAKVNELTEKLATPAQPLVPTNKLSPQEVVDQFGEDFAAAVGAIAAQVADERVKEFRPQVEAAQQTATRSARAQFMAELLKSAPDWQAIDQDPRFTQFLDETDAMSGRPRRDFFNDADARNDATRIAAFFTAFRGSTSSVPVPTPPAQNPAIQAQLAPSSSRNNDAPPGKKLWTQSDIRQFYVQARKGLINQQDFDRIESDIFAAQREGRLAA